MRDEKAVAETLDAFFDAADVDEIGTEADDHRGVPPVAPRARFVHQRAHAPDGSVEAGEDRLADEEMPDVEFADFRNGGDGLDRVEAETVSGMHFETELGAVTRAHRAMASSS